MSPNPGGLESYVLNMYRGIDKEKIRFDFLSNFEEPLAVESKIDNANTTIHRIVSRKKNPIKSYCQLKKIFKENRYDYVHLHIMTYNWLTPAILAYKYGAKVILHSHSAQRFDAMPKKEKVLNYLGKWNLKRFKYLKLACSEKAGESLFGTDYQIMENGIDYDKFKYSDDARSVIRNKYKITDDEIVIGHVGNFVDIKNYPFIVNVFNQILKINANCRLMLIGDYHHNTSVLEQIKNLKIEDKVILTGKIDDSHIHYSAMDAYFLPSHFEGLNISLIEAQANGLKCFINKDLDQDGDISGNIYPIDIQENDNKVAHIILANYQVNNRNIVHLRAAYDYHKAALKLQHFYIEHL